ncbi:MAG: alpha/beta fold hydrolase [Ruminococcus sp.]|nr:alpha/beta fold hydrolase [Ruminococcus sp.]
MLYLIILLLIILFLIIFLIAPAVVIYRSVFGRRKVLPLDDPKLYKPAIEPFRERMLSDWNDLKEKGFDRVTVKARDDVTLCADYYDRGVKRTVIMSHGYNADPYVNLVSPAKWFYDNGFNVLIIYHRAHGCSGGKRSGMGMIEKNDILTWIDFILKKDGSQRILLYGISMGGTTLAYLSDTLREERIPCMVIDCGFISTENQLRHDAKRMRMPPLLIPFLRLLCRWDQHIDIRERTTDHLKNAKKPILFIHGTADLTVPFEEGIANYDACSSEKRMVIVEGAGHTTAFLTDEKQVADAMKDYIDTYFKEIFT